MVQLPPLSENKGLYAAAAATAVVGGGLLLRRALRQAAGLRPPPLLHSQCGTRGACRMLPASIGAWGGPPPCYSRSLTIALNQHTPAGRPSPWRAPTPRAPCLRAPTT